MNLVLVKALTGLEVERDRSGRIARREDFRQARFQVKRLEIPVLQCVFFLSFAAPTKRNAGGLAVDRSVNHTLLVDLCERVRKRLSRKPWVKTSLAPGSTVVTDYLDRAGLTEELNGLDFNLVGYGCTTCIGNSGPLEPEITAAIDENDLVVCSVLSGNRNFEGRISQDVKANYLASPPLVVAYALAGRMDVDIENDPLGEDQDGNPVYLRDVWPDPDEVARVVGESIRREMFTKNYGEVFEGNQDWKDVSVPEGDRYTWPDSTYVRRPSFFEDIPVDPPGVAPIESARVLALLGDSITLVGFVLALVLVPASNAMAGQDSESYSYQGKSITAKKASTLSCSMQSDVNVCYADTQAAEAATSGSGVAALAACGVNNLYEFNHDQYDGVEFYLGPALGCGWHLPQRRFSDPADRSPPDRAKR